MGRKKERIIEEQINAWSHQNFRNLRSRSKQRKKPAITISREFGALGAALGRLMGEEMDYKVWDDELLSAIADELNSNENMLETVDERLREPVQDTFAGFLKNIHTNVNYLRTLIRVVKTIESSGNCIIVGRGAKYICQKKSSLHIRVVCPLEKRVEGYAERENISKEQALNIIREKDAERANFVEYNFNKDVTNASDYDLVLNSDTYTLEEMADIAQDAYKKKTKSLVEG
jgi:cytidylate kinase